MALRKARIVFSIGRPVRAEGRNAGMANAITTETLRTLQAEVPVSATLHVWLKAVTPDAPGTMAFVLVGDKIG
jgi:hypothetical protein